MINWTLVQILSAIAIFLIAIRWVDKTLFAYFGVPLPFWHNWIWAKKGWGKFSKKKKGGKNAVIINN